ncbi:CHASE3 domain-containing protein [Verrucomicrobium sp. GAS474]|nr:response regulator [Verrucomicrobium sp. GAS474]SDU22038.1 CHASE3 domain-containing protein [Verrucomicrobium sp. GAS474]
MLALFGVAIFLSLHSFRGLVGTGKEVVETRNRAHALARLSSGVFEENSDYRGYLLTGESSYLDQVVQMREEMEASLARLHSQRDGSDSERLLVESYRRWQEAISQNIARMQESAHRGRLPVEASVLEGETRALDAAMDRLAAQFERKQQHRREEFDSGSTSGIDLLALQRRAHALARLSSEVFEANSDYRGYLLTGNGSFLEQLRQMEGEMGGSLARLRPAGGEPNDVGEVEAALRRWREGVSLDAERVRKSLSGTAMSVSPELLGEGELRELDRLMDSLSDEIEQDSSRQTEAWQGKVFAALQDQMLLSLLILMAMGGMGWLLYSDARRGRKMMALSAARDAAEEGARVKSEFLANMSHEIRTPMNGVIGMAELLRETELTSDQRQQVEIIGRSGDALLSIINDILDFSKIEAGQFQLDLHSFNLRDCVERTLESLAPIAAERKIDLLCRIDPGMPLALVGDDLRLRQVLLNLAGNAVKFTAQGEVEIALRGIDAPPGTNVGGFPGFATIHFSIRDTGIGIPREKIAGLFSAFTQVDTSTHRHYGGTGLGLAISQRIVGKMGGVISVESAPGVGSVFSFTLTFPLSREELPEPIPEQGKLRLRKVLIVDDSEANRAILVQQTRSWGMVPEKYGTSAEALERLRREGAFDVALIDYHMPGMNGDELAGEMGKLAPDLPILILSSAAPTGSAEPGLPSVKRRLWKPLRQEALYRALVEVLASGSQGSETKPQKSAASSLDSSTALRSPLRILVAEDNLVNQRVACGLLRGLGYQPDVVPNGAAVLEAVERRQGEGQPYDLVLMDVQMPGLDGLAATRQLRQAPYAAGLRIVAMTANAMANEVRECAEAGMDDYIGKPFHGKDLTLILERSYQARQKGH